jgi:hypothetical protein
MRVEFRKSHILVDFDKREYTQLRYHEHIMPLWYSVFEDEFGIDVFLGHLGVKNEAYL